MAEARLDFPWSLGRTVRSNQALGQTPRSDALKVLDFDPLQMHGLDHLLDQLVKIQQGLASLFAL